MKTFKRICLVILFLPALLPASNYADLQPRDLSGHLRKISPLGLTIMLIYWLILTAGLAVIAVAYLGK